MELEEERRQEEERKAFLAKRASALSMQSGSSSPGVAGVFDDSRDAGHNKPEANASGPQYHAAEPSSVEPAEVKLRALQTLPLTYIGTINMLARPELLAP